MIEHPLFACDQRRCRLRDVVALAGACDIRYESVMGLPFELGLGIAHCGQRQSLAAGTGLVDCR